VTEQALAQAAQPDGEKIPQFPYQLVDSYLHACSVERREATADDPEQDQPTFETSFVTEDLEDLDGFLAHLTVSVTARFRAGATCFVTGCTTGVFRRIGQPEPGIAERFRQADCAVLLWPYARTNTAELVRMAQLPLPPLPTIDVRLTLNQIANSEG
jgi:preprotein translocase subunit SecB